MSASVLLIGATGLVGGECLKLLVKDPAISRIVVLTRGDFAPPPGRNPVGHHRIDFDRPDTFREFLNVDVVICTLGTTIKKAGSQEHFRRVDYEYPLRFAELARQAGATQFVIVTAIGASADSRVFYNRVKGDVERDLAKLNYPRLTILRPSLILGERQEIRWLERASVLTMGALRGLFPRSFRPVPASAIARAAVGALRDQAHGTRIITNAEISRAAV